MKKRTLGAAAFFEFPPAVTAGGMSLYLYENIGCTVEGYGEILCYTESLLRLKTQNGILRIEGERFEIAELDCDTLMLKGRVDAFSREKDERE